MLNLEPADSFLVRFPMNNLHIEREHNILIYLDDSPYACPAAEGTDDTPAEAPFFNLLLDLTEMYSNILV